MTARLATLTHPVGVAVLLAAGGGAASSAFAVLHGNGNGLSLTACAGLRLLRAPAQAAVHHAD